MAAIFPGAKWLQVTTLSLSKPHWQLARIAASALTYGNVTVTVYLDIINFIVLLSLQHTVQSWL